MKKIDICTCEIKKMIENIATEKAGKYKIKWTKRITSIAPTIENRIKELNLNLEVSCYFILPENNTITIIISNTGYMNIIKITITVVPSLDILLFNYSFLKMG